MPSSKLIIVLDVYAEVPLDEALGAHSSANTRWVHRLSDFDMPPFEGSQHRALPWPELLAAADRMLSWARETAEGAGDPGELYLGGLAPLPLFLYVARHITWPTSRILLFNRRKDGVWDVLPLSGGHATGRLFLSRTVRIPAISSPDGRLAIFLSTLGQPAPYALIEDLLRRHKQDLSALIEINTQTFIDLDERSSPSVYKELCQLLAPISLQHPVARGAACFIAGPTALASMLGFALPSSLTDAWFTHHEGGAYHVAIPVLPTETPTILEEISPALRLHTLRVCGFKSIRDSGTVTLPALAVIVGRNGSGKSSMLEALQWLQVAAAQGLRAATKAFHAFSDLRNKSCSRLEIELEFTGGPDEPPLRYSLTASEGLRGAPFVESERCHFGEQDEISTEEHGVRRIIGGLSVRDPDQLALISVAGTGATGAARLRAFLRRMVFLRLNPRQLAQPGLLQADPQGPLLDEEGATLPALLDSLTSQDLDGVTTRMQAVLAGSAPIERVDVQRNAIERTGVLVVDHHLTTDTLPDGARSSRPFRLPAWVLSEGTRRLSALFALLALRPAPSLLAIEEVENGLDPWTLGHVLDALTQAADAGTNIVITTHSPFFLDKFDPDQIIHAVYENGESHYRLITSYEDVVRYEGEVEPGVMYISDYFSKRS